MLNLDQVAAYLAVLDTGSFHQAARRLGVTQSSVSQQIRKLEHTVGAQLVLRDRAGCRPAPRTGDFHRYCDALMRLSERATRTFTRPVVEVGAASNIGVYLLPPMHRRFVEQVGDTVELRPTIDHNRAIADLLAIDAIDVALMEWWDNRPGFDASAWRSEELVVIVGPDHAWRSRQSVRLAELAGQRLLGGEPYSGTKTLLRSQLDHTDTHLSTALNLGTTEAVKQAVRNGLGISLVLAGAILDEAEQGHLHSLRISDIKLRKQLMVIHRSNLLPDGPVSAFVNLVQSDSAHGTVERMV